MENTLKKCRECFREKPTSEFHKDSRCSDGYSTICKECKRKYRTSGKYRQTERELEKTQQYKSRKQRYRSTLKGKFYKSLEHHRHRCNGEHSLTFAQWNTLLNLQGHCCAICKTKFTDNIKPVCDCIIPLAHGGMLTFENTQILCKSCNSKKGRKMFSGLINREKVKYLNQH